ncbi:MAG: HAD family phosphatase [Oscillospiraceae bacterium]|jgi:HAD superfamily hydrolase (TIGR01509 family)|nr:HAD family phosphatase [Oscillospiraceae bacterium]
MQKIKAVFFDMDGTVLDTEPIHAVAFGQALEKLGIKDGVGFLSRCIGLNVPEMRKLFMREVGTEAEFDKINALAWEIADKLKKQHGIKVKQGFFELAESLSENGVKAYIVTSTPRKPALRDLETAGIAGYFVDFICFGDYEKGKPAPEPYLKALKLSGENADECIAIEDSEAGLTSAVSAGLRCVLVRDMAVIPEETARLAYADLKTLADLIDL